MRVSRRYNETFLSRRQVISSFSAMILHGQPFSWNLGDGKLSELLRNTRAKTRKPATAAPRTGTGFCLVNELLPIYNHVKILVPYWVNRAGRFRKDLRNTVDVGPQVKCLRDSHELHVAIRPEMELVIFLFQSFRFLKGYEATSSDWNTGRTHAVATWMNQVCVLPGQGDDGNESNKDSMTQRTPDSSNLLLENSLLENSLANETRNMY